MAMKTFLFIIFLSLINAGCNRSSPVNYNYEPPEDMNDGLETGSLEEAGMDAEKIAEAVRRIIERKYGEVHSMLIYKSGKLVLEEYFEGHKYAWDAPMYRGEYVNWDRNMFHQIMSCTKSVTSACFDIAIQKGYIQSVSQSIFDYLPQHQQFNAGEKSGITIEHLLTMTSGLEWDEWHAPHATAANDIDRLYIECWEDPLSCVLEKPMVSTPGESFTYNGGGLITLGEILKNASGMNIEEFSKRYLFNPLGIDSIKWDVFPEGEFETAGGLHIRPRDMMKFGVTYLNGGVWNGKQIVTSDWVKKSSEIYNNNSGIKLPIEDSGRNGYGYTWWISEVGKGGKKTHMFRTNGWGGQVIMVLPEKEMVVVFTGGNYTSRSSLFHILERYILPASD
jgi:CubicO group peptidase (beta-lactamase class C family)